VSKDKYKIVMAKDKKNKMKKILLIALTMFFACSYVYAKDSKELILANELSKINLGNPKQDLTANIGRDDLRFIGLYGYAKYFPGIDEKYYSLIDKYGTLMFEGTSDSIESSKHNELIQKAKLYAETYNTALLSHIKKHNVKPQEGYVPDEETAIAIAVAIWRPIYGKKEIEKQKPYNAILKDGIWFVSGSLPKGWLGGVAEAEIIRENGKIIRISHGK
jgi:hypothetical protein